jgi:hypothetical protein
VSIRVSTMSHAPCREPFARFAYTGRMSSLRKYPPLQRHQLPAIYDRNRSPEVRTLLWEIARLRRLVMKVDDFFRAMSRNRHANRFDSVSEKILDEIYTALQNEPAISERDDED